MMYLEKSLVSFYFFGFKIFMKIFKICKKYVDFEEYFSVEFFVLLVEDLF